MAIKALACELPAANGVPLARWHAGSRPSRHRTGYRRLDLGHHHLAVTLGRRHPSLAVAQLDLPRDPDFARKAGRVLDLYHRKGIPPAASSLLLMTPVLAQCTSGRVHTVLTRLSWANLQRNVVVFPLQTLASASRRMPFSVSTARNLSSCVFVGWQQYGCEVLDNTP